MYDIVIIIMVNDDIIHVHKLPRGSRLAFKKHGRTFHSLEYPLNTVQYSNTVSYTINYIVLYILLQTLAPYYYYLHFC